MRSINSTDLLRIAMKSGGAGALLYVVTVDALIFTNEVTVASIRRTMHSVAESVVSIYLLYFFSIFIVFAIAFTAVVLSLILIRTSSQRLR